MGDKVIILRETLWQSILSDTYTFAMCFALILPGVWLDSGAMQWVGGVLLLLGIMNKASGAGKRMTIEQARAKLDEIEASHG